MCMDFQFFLVLHDNSSPNSSYRTKLLQKTFPIIKSCTGEIIRIYVLIHAINKLIPYGTSLSLKEKNPNLELSFGISVFEEFVIMEPWIDIYNFSIRIYCLNICTLNSKQYSWWSAWVYDVCMIYTQQFKGVVLKN